MQCREHKAEASEAGPSKGKGVLYWLRQDFRLHDNPALSAAAQAAKKQACSVHQLHGREGASKLQVQSAHSTFLRTSAFTTSLLTRLSQGYSVAHLDAQAKGCLCRVEKLPLCTSPHWRKMGMTLRQVLHRLTP